MLKNYSRLRSVLIALFFVLGLSLVYYGWSLTGQMYGLILMLVGVALLLLALYLYNKPYR